MAGDAHMVDVGGKPETPRRAEATAVVRLSEPAFAALTEGRVPKGDVLATARLAGIAAAKRTPDLLPLCHPVRLTSVSVEAVALRGEEGPRVEIRASAEAVDRTGVEMEALTAAATAALTVYDMLKGLERGLVIESLRLESKSGGRSGPWKREEEA
jgi:cyclic pyranopterin phosphate synthase